MIKLLAKTYGNNKVKRGTRHKYIGMNLDYEHWREVKVSMIPHVEKIIENVPKWEHQLQWPCCWSSISSQESHRGKAPTWGKGNTFCCSVAQLLFVSTRAQIDIQTAVVSFSKSIISWWGWLGKLKRVIKYLNGTIYVKLMLSACNIGIIHWYVDESYSFHDDCKGHTGSVMALGLGTVTSFSRKQKINAKSWVEAELIKVDDDIPQILWTRYFMECQDTK